MMQEEEIGEQERNLIRGKIIMIKTENTEKKGSEQDIANDETRKIEEKTF